MTISYRTNYPHNTVQWDVGAQVWHDCDAKKPELLATVVASDPANGTCDTEYRDPRFLARNPSYRGKRLTNPIEVLHDPARWVDGRYADAEGLAAWEQREGWTR